MIKPGTGRRLIGHLVMQVGDSDYGFHYAAIRHPIKQPALNEYFRVTEYIPFTCLIPPNSAITSRR